MSLSPTMPTPPVAPWFVVLPDTPAGAALAASVEAAVPDVQAVRRPSGSVWLLGHWAPDELVQAAAGPSRLALIGCVPVRWARLARAHLAPEDFDVLPRERLPLVYQGISQVSEPLDRPFIGVIDRAKLLAGLRLAARHGPRLHLCGLGGDEVAQGAPNFLADLARGHPLAACAFDGSRLAELGLVDAERLQALCRYSAAPDRHYLALQQTAAAESWLRSDARRRLFAGPGQDAWPQAAPVTGSLTPLETTC